jgi:hypothetical protein
MQTLDRSQDLTDNDAATPSHRRRGAVVWVALGAVVVVVAAGVAYAIGVANSDTKTVVKKVEVAAPTPSTAALNCVPGLAEGSCNTDEFAEQKIPFKPLSAADQAKLQVELIAAREAAFKYPTVADARKAGFIQAGNFSPLVGAHFIDAGALGAFDPSRPGSYIYDGISDTSRITGLMYLSSTPQAPEGFVGPNDHWHRHINTCVVYGGPQGIKVPFPADSDVTKSMCDSVKGSFMRTTQYMVHAWVVPGWESPGGVFAHDNDHLRCADGTLNVEKKLGTCKGT